MKLAYCPISGILEAPGDYRRFVGFAKLANLKFEILFPEDLNTISDGQFMILLQLMALTHILVK